VQRKRLCSRTACSFILTFNFKFLFRYNLSVACITGYEDSRGEKIPRSGTGMGENPLRHTSRGWGRGFFFPAGTGMGAQPSTEISPLSSLDSWLAACHTLHYIHVRVERNKSVLTHLAPRSMMLRYITSVASVSHKR
jgi:hypothetical protein